MNDCRDVQVLARVKSIVNVLLVVKSPPPDSPAPAVSVVVEATLLLKIFQSVDERYPLVFVFDCEIEAVPFENWRGEVQIETERV